MLIDVIPFKCDAAIQISCPIFSKCICCFDARDKMIDIVLLTYFTPKSSTMRVNEIGQVLCFQRPGVFTHSVYPNGASLLRRRLFAKNASLWEALHGLLHFDVNIAIVCMLDQVVLLHPSQAGKYENGMRMYSKYSSMAVR